MKFSFFEKRITSADSYAQWFRGMKSGEEGEENRLAFLRDLEHYDLKLEEAMVALSKRIIDVAEKELDPLVLKIDRLQAQIEQSVNRGDIQTAKLMGIQLKKLNDEKAALELGMKKDSDARMALMQQLRVASRKLRRALNEQQTWTKIEAREIGGELRNMYLSGRRLESGLTKNNWRLGKGWRYRAKKSVFSTKDTRDDY